MRLFDRVYGWVTLVAHCVHKGLIIRKLIIGRKVYRQVVGTCVSQEGNVRMPAYSNLRGAYSRACICDGDVATGTSQERGSRLACDWTL